MVHEVKLNFDDPSSDKNSIDNKMKQIDQYRQEIVKELESDEKISKSHRRSKSIDKFLKSINKSFTFDKRPSDSIKSKVNEK